MKENLYKLKMALVGMGTSGEKFVKMVKDIKGDDDDTLFVGINSKGESVYSSELDMFLSVPKSQKRSLLMYGKNWANKIYGSIENLIDSQDMFIITAGLGGQEGFGISSIFAKMARKKGKLVLGVVTLPFEFEDAFVKEYAYLGVERLSEYVDVLLVIPNDVFLKDVTNDEELKCLFEESDEFVVRSIDYVINEIYDKDLSRDELLIFKTELDEKEIGIVKVTQLDDINEMLDLM